MDYQNQELRQQELMAERYQKLMDAFRELIDKGVSGDTISTFVFETGFSADELEMVSERII